MKKITSEVADNKLYVLWNDNAECYIISETEELSGWIHPSLVFTDKMQAQKVANLLKAQPIDHQKVDSHYKSNFSALYSPSLIRDIVVESHMEVEDDWDDDWD